MNIPFTGTCQCGSLPKRRSKKASEQTRKTWPHLCYVFFSSKASLPVLKTLNFETCHVASLSEITLHIIGRSTSANQELTFKVPEG
jgi:hypothetical protein